MWRKIEEAIATELERDGWFIRSAGDKYAAFTFTITEDDGGITINLTKLAKALEDDLT